MPARPVQGDPATSGVWGAALNAWLDVAHNADGTVKPLPYRSNLAASAALYETFPRTTPGAGSVATLTSQTLYLAAIDLPAGLAIGHIAFMSGGTAAVTPANWWFGLYDSSRVQLALTADQLTAAWGTFTVKSLAIATVASGAAASFTTTYTGLHYLGILVNAATVPSLEGVPAGTAVTNLPPVLYGNSDTTQTTPPAFAHTANAITGVAAQPYGYVAV